MAKFNSTQTKDVSKLQESMRDSMARATSLEAAAQSCVSAIYETYSESLVLARLYASIPFAQLPASNRAFVRSLAESKGVVAKLRDTTPVLTLLGTRGVMPAWNDRHNSQGHVGIPLVATSFVESIPMLARLLQELGVGLDWIDKQDIHEVDRILAGGMCSLFHVDDAATAVDRLNRKIIPAQDFVQAHRVQTVFGMGGGYVGGAFASFIFFSRESIPRTTAQRLVPIVNVFKATTMPLVLSGRFCAAA